MGQDMTTGAGLRVLQWIVVVLWLAVLALLFMPEAPPIESLGGDTVEPATVRPGDRVSVTRSFRIVRSVPMSVNRTMVRGDCKRSCDIVDLANGSLTLEAGDHLNVVRPHVIPAFVSPGQWELRFTVVWEDRLGRQRKTVLPELPITVVEK